MALIMHPQDEHAEEVAISFRAAILADRASGVSRPLSAHLEEFPRAYWDLLVREYVALSSSGESGREGTSEECAPASRLSQYRIETELGRGGQGVVHLAEDTLLHRKVALKVIEGFRGRLTLERLRREAGRLRS